jgi:para-aminobenzoate synthetase/4-amino-4-deoxychorismate lyase
LPVRVALARRPVDSTDVFLYHKTTNRRVYDERREEYGPEYEDVILWNERGEITESTIANIVMELDGRKVTPPVDCGLLAGTFRRRLLASGEAVEQVVCVEDLARCSRVWLVNSVRGWREAFMDRQRA